MRRIRIWISIVCLIMTAAVSQAVTYYGRTAGGSWHDTNSTWKVSGSYVTTLPGPGDIVSLTTADDTIDLFESAVSIQSLAVGTWEATLAKSLTLNVSADLTTAGGITIGSDTGHPGNGSMAVSNATVLTTGTTSIGKTAQGTLTLDDGAVFSNSTWRIDMGADGLMVINDGTVSMVNGLIMTEGARVDINGNSELWVMNNDLTQAGDPLMQYIYNGWVYGNGIAGNVDITYDGTKTIVTAVPLAAATVSRSSGGSWHATSNAWKIAGSYIYRTPISTDGVVLTSTENATINLYEDSAEVKNLTLGSWGGAESVVTLLVNTNLSTVAGGVSISSTANIGSGIMIISNATVSAVGSTSIGKTSTGSLIVNDGGVFENTAWWIDMGTNASIVVNDGTVSMVNSLQMTEGARVDINGDSELWIVGNDQTASGSLLMQHVSNGWIYGNGVAGNVTATYDGSKTIVTAALPEAHLSISCSSSNVVVSSIDLSSLALSNVLQKCSVLGGEWSNVPPVSVGSSSNSWTVPSVDQGEFFRIRSWF